MFISSHTRYLIVFRLSFDRQISVSTKTERLIIVSSGVGHHSALHLIHVFLLLKLNIRGL